MVNCAVGHFPLASVWVVIVSLLTIFSVRCRPIGRLFQEVQHFVSLILLITTWHPTWHCSAARDNIVKAETEIAVTWCHCQRVSRGRHWSVVNDSVVQRATEDDDEMVSAAAAARGVWLWHQVNSRAIDRLQRAVWVNDFLSKCRRWSALPPLGWVVGRALGFPAGTIVSSALLTWSTVRTDCFLYENCCLTNEQTAEIGRVASVRQQCGFDILASSSPPRFST